MIVLHNLAGFCKIILYNLLYIGAINGIINLVGFIFREEYLLTFPLAFQWSVVNKNQNRLV